MKPAPLSVAAWSATGHSRRVARGRNTSGVTGALRRVVVDLFADPGVTTATTRGLLAAMAAADERYASQTVREAIALEALRDGGCLRRLRPGVFEARAVTASAAPETLQGPWRSAPDGLLPSDRHVVAAMVQLHEHGSAEVSVSQVVEHLAATGTRYSPRTVRAAMLRLTRRQPAQVRAVRRGRYHCDSA